MGRIAESFRTLRLRGECALVPFITAGDPDLATTEAIVLALAQSGANLIELGVPFSDPIAEGPTIQRSSERALRGKTSLRRVLRLVQGLRPKVQIPLLLMGYANPFYAMGEENFAAAAAEVGVDGIIVVDLPPEEGEKLFATLDKRGIDVVLLAAPTTTAVRREMLARRTRGFLYYVSLTGVTGARTALAQGIREGVEAVRRIADIPICVGFGVSTPEQAREIAGYADGVAVGSALVDRIAKCEAREEAVDAAARFVAELKAGMQSP